MADKNVREAYEQAQREWPKVDLLLDTFRDYVEARWAKVEAQLDSEPQTAEDGLEATPDTQTSRSRTGNGLAYASDLYLACACSLGDSAAVQHLDTLLPQLLVPVHRIDPSAAFVDEVRQQFLEKLLLAGPSKSPRIELYLGTGTLVAWGRAVATRIALDLRRKHHREVPLAGEHLNQVERMGGSATNLEMQYLKSLYATEFTAALTTACAALEARSRTVLRMRFVDELNIDQIGLIYSVHRATIARWIVQARQALWTTTREELEASLHKTLSTSEFHSYIHLVKSQLDLCVASILASSDRSEFD